MLTIPTPQGLAQVFAQVFTELGGEVVLTTAVNKGDANMEPVLTAVPNAQAELMFFPILQIGISIPRNNPWES